jgi:hypothetical protein
MKDIILFASSVGAAALLRKILAHANFANKSSTTTLSRILDQNYIDEFLSRGVVVIRGVLDEKELNDCRDGLHKYLLERGVSCLYKLPSVDAQLICKSISVPG